MNINEIRFQIFCLFFWFFTTYSLCPGACNGHGTCSTNNLCTCTSNWEGIDCSKKVCPKEKPWVDYASANDVARSTTIECSNKGICDTNNGKCQCDIGFTGLACERLSCYKNCNGHGRCMSMSEIAEERNDFNLFYSTTYNSNWDSEKIYGCVCDQGYHGADCSMKSCPVGDDPMTTGQINEVQIISCLCNGCTGSFTVSFKDKTTTTLISSSTASDLEIALEALTTINGVTVAIDGGATLCDTDGNSIKITFTNDPGNQPPLRVTSFLTATSNLAVQEGGSTGLYGSTPSSVDGTKEDLPCSGRGTCDEINGICTCDSGFSSSDGNEAAGILGECSYMTTIPTACPESTCNDHGTCSTSYKSCTCDSDWRGHDCSLRRCPYGKAWFDEAISTDIAHTTLVECSNMGICDTLLGTCTCFNGFTGPACERMECPGGGNCLERGQCLTMGQLASFKESNGVITSFTYGDSYSPDTWDANMIQGCHCDKIRTNRGQILQFQGYSCEKIPCPKGDDPWTTGQVDEVQTISCKATGGTFTLTFRGETTRSLAYSASASQVKTALDDLLTIDTVLVTFQSSATEACTSDSTNMDITFITNPGNVPDIQITSTSLTGVVVTNVIETTPGTKENVECNQRGNCDSTQGRCICAIDWASSNGAGALGTTDDCGYRDILMTHGEL